MMHAQRWRRGLGLRGRDGLGVRAAAAAVGVPAPLAGHHRCRAVGLAAAGARALAHDRRGAQGQLLAVDRVGHAPHRDVRRRHHCRRHRGRHGHGHGGASYSHGCRRRTRHKRRAAAAIRIPAPTGRGHRRVAVALALAGAIAQTPRGLNTAARNALAILRVGEGANLGDLQEHRLAAAARGVPSPLAPRHLRGAVLRAHAGGELRVCGAGWRDAAPGDVLAIGGQKLVLLLSGALRGRGRGRGRLDLDCCLHEAGAGAAARVPAPILGCD
mmetsp:Transcript_82525/g.209862  ORF Transcript_82525/g.209862 Transcript_82525/m.209862 type:complete len:271 (-) Transcript_82525:390-1202(-)